MKKSSIWAGIFCATPYDHSLNEINSSGYRTASFHQVSSRFLDGTQTKIAKNQQKSGRSSIVARCRGSKWTQIKDIPSTKMPSKAETPVRCALGDIRPQSWLVFHFLFSKMCCFLSFKLCENSKIRLSCSFFVTRHIIWLVWSLQGLYRCFYMVIIE